MYSARVVARTPTATTSARYVGPDQQRAELGGAPRGRELPDQTLGGLPGQIVLAQVEVPLVGSPRAAAPDVERGERAVAGERHQGVIGRQRRREPVGLAVGGRATT